jgi:kynureninase
MDCNELYTSPNALAPHYSRFDVGNRLLLTGHSHQAWPNCAEEGLLESFADASAHIDDKWGRAFEKAQRVCRGIAHWMSDESGTYCLAQNTHDLVFRFLSALPYKERIRIVTTDSEFHSLQRQLQRLEEEGIEVVRIQAHPVSELAEKLCNAIDDRTVATLVSGVFFNSGQIAPNLGDVATRCHHHGIPMLVDLYHATGVLPYPLAALGLDDVYVVGGGYKYLQLGEGNGFLRTPADTQLRPIYTGWFAEFGELDAPPQPGAVSYAKGSSRFGGATYDPASHYRGAAVMDFFEEQNLTPEFLREVSQHQIGLLIHAFDALDLNPEYIARTHDVPVSGLGGFLSLESPHAVVLSKLLREMGVSTDARGERLRFGPAPYLSDTQIKEAMEKLPMALARVE